MKVWSLLCFLVVAAPAFSLGHEQNQTGEDIYVAMTTTMLTPPSSHAPEINATDQTPRRPTSPESVNATLLPAKDNVTSGHTETEGGVSSAASPTETTVSTATRDTAANPATTEEPGVSSWAYVIMVLLIMVIIALCVILLCLRRASRTYSFDLHRAEPSTSRFTEPSGTFGAVYVDDLDRPDPKDQVTITDLSLRPITNGTSPKSEDKDATRDNGAAESPLQQSDSNGPETSPVRDSSPTVDETPSSQSRTDLLVQDSVEPQQNENNNNPPLTSCDPFVEINLDEPAWCDQLLTCPQASSSVLPFSTFSFSSSSSSSSS